MQSHTLTIQQPTYTDWLREHAWAQLMNVSAASALQWRWERSGHLFEHGVVAGSRDARGQVTYQVNSESDPERHYHATIEQGCDCPDGDPARPYAGAVLGWCKHRFAAWRYQQWLDTESKAERRG